MLCVNAIERLSTAARRQVLMRLEPQFDSRGFGLSRTSRATGCAFSLALYDVAFTAERPLDSLTTSAPNNQRDGDAE